MKKQVFIFGFGYTAMALANLLTEHEYQVFGTSRRDEQCGKISNSITVLNFFADLESFIERSPYVLISVPPNKDAIDAVYERYYNILLRHKKKFRWIAYLSSTSVYGNYDGNWVDEASTCYPTSETSSIRYQIEQTWLQCVDKLPMHIFRLSGIYGPNRNALQRIMAGKDYTIYKPEHFFSRIHVADIAKILLYSLENPTAGQIYNVSDNEPAPVHVVDEFAAQLLGKTPLKRVSDLELLSDKQKEFFSSHKKISNKKLMKILNQQLLYPTFREGLEYGCLPFL